MIKLFFTPTPKSDGRTLLKDEVAFFARIALLTKRILECRTSDSSNQSIDILNEMLLDLIERIRAKKVSLEGFTWDDADILKTEIFDNEIFDLSLTETLCHEIYGGDERCRNFER